LSGKLQRILRVMAADIDTTGSRRHPRALPVGTGETSWTVPDKLLARADEVIEISRRFCAA